MDSVIHRVNHYPLDNTISFPNTYPFIHKIVIYPLYRVIQRLNNCIGQVFKTFKKSWCAITQTLANSNQNQFPLDFCHTFTVILLLVTQTFDDSNLLKTRSSFCFPSDNLYIILPSIPRNMFRALKSQGENSLLASETLNFEFPIDVL